MLKNAHAAYSGSGDDAIGRTPDSPDRNAIADRSQTARNGTCPPRKPTFLTMSPPSRRWSWPASSVKLGCSTSSTRLPARHLGNGRKVSEDQLALAFDDLDVARAALEALGEQAAG